MTLTTPKNVKRDEWNTALDTAFYESRENPFTYIQVMTGLSVYAYSVLTPSGTKTVLIFKDTEHGHERPWQIQTVKESRFGTASIYLSDVWDWWYETRDAARAGVWDTIIPGVDTNAYEYAVWAGNVGNDTTVVITLDTAEKPGGDSYNLYKFNRDALDDIDGKFRVRYDSLPTDVTVSTDGDTLYAVRLDDKRFIEYWKIDSNGDRLKAGNYTPADVDFDVLKALRAKGKFQTIDLTL